MNDTEILATEAARRAAGHSRAQEILRLVTDGVAEAHREARIARMLKILDPAMQEANDLATEALIEHGMARDVAAAVAAVVLAAAVPTISIAAIQANTIGQRP